MKKTISTAIAYANAGPHIGHAFEYAYADTIARYIKSIYGKENVFFETGMDEHGQKIETKAKETGVEVQNFVDANAELFRQLDAKMSVDYDFFVRTSDKEKHYKGAQFLWNKLKEAGALEKREYSALYCVGCEEFKTEKDLNEKGECPSHLKKPEEVKEENWFFALSRYTEDIKKVITEDRMRISPETRKNEILALLDRGLEDVSFSRPVSKVSWGIPVPGDETQVMYVWCDALSNYITALGYGRGAWESGQEFWQSGADGLATHIIGKDILRFHAAIWPGMLLAAGIALPEQIYVHGFITSGGQKMSKSLGNVISPEDIMNLLLPACGDLSGEAMRFILLHEIPSFDDGDLTMESIRAAYTAHLSNGIGNLTSRIMRMCTSYGVSLAESEFNAALSRERENIVANHLHKGNVSGAALELMKNVRVIDEMIQKDEPFKKIKINEKTAKEDLIRILSALLLVAYELRFFMPKTSEKIVSHIRTNTMPERPLFNRLA